MPIQMADDPSGALRELHTSLQAASASGETIDAMRAAAIGITVRRIVLYCDDKKSLAPELLRMAETARRGAVAAKDDAFWKQLRRLFESTSQHLSSQR